MATTSQVSRDPALETSLFWDQYKMPIIAAVVVLLLAGFGFAGYEFYQQRRASDAAALLTSAKTAQDYQQVIARYPDDDAAASAYLLLADKERQKKNYADANAQLHKFIERFPKHELITTAWMGVAANLESLGKDDEALSTYRRLVSEYPQSYNAPLALLSEVPLLKEKNQTAEARRACETLLAQYRDSALASEALELLQTLPKTAATPAPAGSKAAGAKP